MLNKLEIIINNVHMQTFFVSGLLDGAIQLNIIGLPQDLPAQKQENKAT